MPSFSFTDVREVGTPGLRKGVLPVLRVDTSVSPRSTTCGSPGRSEGQSSFHTEDGQGEAATRDVIPHCPSRDLNPEQLTRDHNSLLPLLAAPAHRCDGVGWRPVHHALAEHKQLPERTLGVERAARTRKQVGCTEPLPTDPQRL